MAPRLLPLVAAILHAAAATRAECTGPSCPPDFCGDGLAPCQNGGRCNLPNTPGDPTVCICPDEWQGTSCQYRAVLCGGGRWCTNGGSCPEGAGHCSCPPGFEGAHCQNEMAEVDRCEEGHVCLNGGLCVTEEHDGHVDACKCPAGFHGPVCQHEATDECGGGRWCTNGGTCPPSGHCECPKGFTGAHCQIETSESGANMGSGSGGGGGEELPGWGIGVLAGSSAGLVCAAGALVHMVRKERAGEPVFSPLRETGDKGPVSPAGGREGL